MRALLLLGGAVSITTISLIPDTATCCSNKSTLRSRGTAERFTRSNWRERRKATRIQRQGRRPRPCRCMDCGMTQETVSRSGLTWKSALCYFARWNEELELVQEAAPRQAL